MPRVRPAIAIVAVLSATVVPFAAAADLAPTRPAVTLRATLTASTGSTSLAVGGPDRFAARPLAGEIGPLGSLVVNRGLRTEFLDGSGIRIARTFPAAPDGAGLWQLLSPSSDTLLARVRGGTASLTPARFAGRASLRGTVRLGGNDCAGLRGGVRTIDLDRATLLPLRVRTQRAGARAEVVTVAPRALNRPVPAAAFRLAGPIRAGDPRLDQGFRRTSPAAAARNLPYAPALPSAAAVPGGFALAVSGWAPRTETTGAEGSIPPGRSLFQAVYARGWERVELTQRASGGRGWPADPFGVECGRLTTTRVTVDGIPATFGIGPEIAPHLFWRDGAVLHTVSGPFPAATLIQIAESLTPVTAS
ncbi:MAG TPA: hypothetical protein PKD59_08755 [Miltoncostaeaceae bacterium]|nr:hypothetical protein [Miltoncostaeaceae bacterium]